MLKVGLTGGIASGKTTVSTRFSRLGVPIIDTDIISRELVEPGKPALQQIADQLGGEFIAVDGSLDRPALRRHIFSHPEARAILEDILHPAIRREVERRLAETADAPYAIVVIPLLVENRLQDMVDRTLLVDAPEELQVERVCRRDNITPKEAEKILLAQATRNERLKAADDLIDNRGDFSDLDNQVKALHDHYLSLADRGTRKG
jgi:dephospho-CoA kinase